MGILDRIRRWIWRPMEPPGVVSVPPPPPPSPPVGGPSDPARAAIWDRLNAMRQAAGRDPFAYDGRLALSAQQHATGLAAGSAYPHENFTARLWAAGYPLGPKGAAEGIASGREMDGPAGLQELISGGPGEAHYEDLFSRTWNRAGIGTAQGNDGTGYLVIDYGAL